MRIASAHKTPARLLELLEVFCDFIFSVFLSFSFYSLFTVISHPCRDMRLLLNPRFILLLPVVPTLSAALPMLTSSLP